MKTFIEHDFQDLERIDGPTRLYKTPEGKLYPSVTTITSMLPKPELDHWRKAVGEEEANRTTERAAHKGTAIHSMCENYLKYGTVETENLFDRSTFNSIKPILDSAIDNIHAIEGRLYSDYLKVAGTTDLVAEYKNVISVIDYKTASKPKHKDQIENYFMQGSAYCVCFEERTGIPISRIVLIIAVDHDMPQVFISRRDNHITGFMQLRKQYLELHGV